MPGREGEPVTPARSEIPEHAIAVTGVGVLTPLGDSPESLAEALRAGRSAIEPLAEIGGAGASRMTDFEATRYANVRGLRLYSRATRFGVCASKLALVDSGLEGGCLEGEQLGVVAASTFGHMDALLEYDRSLVTVGVQRTNPAWMPLGIPSAPGAAIALSFGAKAFSITLADGGASSLDALGLGARLVAGGRARACIVVGAFAWCHEFALSASRAGMLAPSDAFRVFDRRRRGTVLGEAAAAVILERLDDARARGASPRAFVCGQASTFAPEAPQMARALQRACEGALRAADLSPVDLGLVSAGANGSPEGDRAEARALLGALGEAAASVPVIAPKANLGDSIDAGGLLQAVAALSAMRSGQAPAIAGLEQPEIPGLGYSIGEARVDPGYALVTSTSHAGGCSALVLSVPRER